MLSLTTPGQTLAATSSKPPAALAASIPSPVTDAAQTPGTFTGDAGDWAVAIVAGKVEALVYLCDGVHAGQWFGAAIVGGVMTGTAPNGSVVTAKLKSGAWSGTLSVSGKPTAFTAKAATSKNGWGVWRVKPSPFDGPDFLVGWISTARGIRGISQTPSGQTANGVVVTLSASGPALLNGAPITVPPGVAPTSTIAGVVRSAQVGGTPTIPPDPTKLCLLKFIAYELARHDANMAQNQTATKAERDAAVANMNLALERLNTCLTGVTPS